MDTNKKEIQKGNVLADILENGKVNIGKIKYDIYNFQTYTREEVLQLKEVIDLVLNELNEQNVLDSKKLEREEKYR